MSVRGPLGATESGAIQLRTRAIATRARSLGNPIGLLAVAGLTSTTLLIALSAARTEALLPESVRPIPGWLAGPFGNTGIGLGDYTLIAVVLAMLASYALAIRYAGQLSARTVIASIAAMHVLVLLAPPLLSTDIFSYQVYGRLQHLYGFNPYIAGPHAVLDPVVSYVGAKWSYTPTVYGPLFTEISYLLAPLSIASSVLAYKAIAAFASLGTIALVWQSARLRGMNPVKAAALVGLNPLVVVYGVGGGHNDLLMMVLLMAGVYLVLARHERLGSAMMVAAAVVKLTAGVMLAFAIASGGGRRARDHRRDVLLGAVATAALFIGLAFLWFGTGPLHLFATVQKVQSEGDWHSIPGFAGAVLGTSVGHIVGIVLGVGFAGVCAWLLRRTWRGELDWIDAGAWTAFALLITASSLLPWYVVWLLPLAALSSDRRLTTIAVVTTSAVGLLQLIGYIPHVVLF